MIPLDDYLRDRRARVDEALAGWLPAAPACPERLYQAAQYSVMAGGKRLRPVLAMASAEAVRDRDRPPADGLEAPVRAVMPVACALELIHTYSLIHDDLPAMDNDTLRRGRPTSHVVFGEGLAILAGDALLTQAFSVLACGLGRPDGVPADRALRIVGIIAVAAGAVGMVGGQVLDLQAAGFMPSPDGGRLTLDAEGLRTMHAMKTGALIRAAAVSGAIVGGASEDHVQAIDAFATEIGLAFQIVDDVLDVEGEAATLGKTKGKDAAAGKPTYPSLYGLGTSRRLAQECIARAKAALNDAGLAGRLPALADYVAARTS